MAEAAGLALGVLGAIPVLCKALSAYKETTVVIQEVRYFDKSLRSIVGDFDYHIYRFKSTLEDVFNEALPHSATVGDILRNYSHELWTEEEARTLSEKLGSERHKIFQHISQSFADNIFELAKIIKRIQNDKVKKEETSSRRTAARLAGRMTLLFNRLVIKSLDKELEKLGQRMSELTKKPRSSHHVESRPASNDGLVRNLVGLLRQARGKADLLFRTFHAAWLSGSCRCIHEAMIYLEPPFQMSQTKGFYKPTSSQYRLLVRSGSSSGTNCLPSWHETSVVIPELTECLYPQGQQSPSTNTPMINVTPVPPVDDSAGSFDNLCEEIGRARNLRKGSKLTLRDVGIFSSELTEPWYGNMPTDEAGFQLATLHALASRKREIPLKIRLAFQLATALMNFSSSQWMGQGWERIHILNSQPSNGEFEHPVIRQVFPEVSSPSELAPRIMFQQLGILMLEIWTEQTCEAWVEGYLANNPTEGSASGLSRSDLGRAWYEAKRHKIPPVYGDIVKAALDFSFDCKSIFPSWEDWEFQKAVCGTVIQPLIEQCQTFT